VAGKAENRQAIEKVGAYHEACLAQLIDSVGEALDRYRAGEIDAFAMDEVIHQYHNAARKLWSFCWAGSSSRHRVAALAIDDMAARGEPVDWWAEGATRRTRE